MTEKGESAVETSSIAAKADSTQAKTTEKPKKPRRIIRRRKRPEDDKPPVDPVLLQQVLNQSSLPKDYSFEIPKTVKRITNLGATHVALQMPEGLLLYATSLCDVLKRLCGCLKHVSVLGDVTYGACCIDDLGAKAMGAELLVHYGHSCLVPIQHTALPCLYVFCEIRIDVQHLVDCVCETVPEHTRLYLMGTVQFRNALAEASSLLEKRKRPTTIPQAKPLSPGEVLGCTSPKLEDRNAVVVFCADGRFHLESTMISNPNQHMFLRYDPYSKLLTEERYDTPHMKQLRSNAIQQAQSAKVFGVVLGTLGRQGNPSILQNIRQLLSKHKKRSFVMLLSELSPAKLSLVPVDAWVQIACPRLSVDWGHYFEKPVLSPYELHVCLQETNFKEDYPMDFYSLDGGPWANYHERNRERQCKEDCSCE